MGTGTLDIADGGTLRTDANGTLPFNINLGTTGGTGATWSNTNNATATVTALADLRKGTVSTNLSVASGGTLRALDSNNLVTISGTVAVQSGGTLLVSDVSSNANVTELNVTGTITNAGTVTLSGNDDAVLDLTGGGKLINQVGGSVTLNVSEIRGDVDNAGSITASSANTLVLGSTDFDNQSGGTFLINTASSVTLTGSGSGRFNNFAGATLTVTGTLNMGNHDLFDAGTINGFNNITFNTNGGGYFVGKAFDAAGYTVAGNKKLGVTTGGSLVGTGTLTVDDNGRLVTDVSHSIASTLTLNFGTISNNGAMWSGSGTATINGTANLNGGNVSTNLLIASTAQVRIANADATLTFSGTVNNQSTSSGNGGIRIEDTLNDGGESEVLVTGTINNTGSIVLIATGSAPLGAKLVMSGAGVLNNNSGGVVQTAEGNNTGVRQLSGTINNNVGATIDVDYNTTYVTGTLTNTGTIDVASGKTLTIASGATLSNGAGGVYAGTGTLAVNGGATLQFVANGQLLLALR